MKSDNFILCLSAYLSEAKIDQPLTEAARFVIEYPDVVADTTPQDASQECIARIERKRLEALYNVADQVKSRWIAPSNEELRDLQSKGVIESDDDLARKYP